MKNESFLKPYYLILALFICGFMHSQSYSYFLYESSANQYFRFHPGASKKMLYVNMDRNDIVFNSIFNIDERTSKLIIPSSGFYEISGYYHFNLNTGNVKNSRAGINFGFVQIKSGIEEYIASKRVSYTENTQNLYSDIYIHPTIVYLEEGVVIAPAVSTGLLDKPIVNGHIGCEKNNKDCISLKWSLKKISNETNSQKYF